jgi:hypothetical protein
MGGVSAFFRQAGSRVSALWGTDTIRIVNFNIDNISIDEFVVEANTPEDLGVTNINIMDGTDELLVSHKKVAQPNIYTLQEVDKGHRRTNRVDVAKHIGETLTEGDEIWQEYTNVHSPSHIYNEGEVGNALISNVKQMPA